MPDLVTLPVASSSFELLRGGASVVMHDGRAAIDVADDVRNALVSGAEPPLSAGRNELLIADSEDFGGWGLQARFAD